jgi:hypothetical protein
LNLIDVYSPKCLSQLKRWPMVLSLIEVALIFSAV